MMLAKRVAGCFLGENTHTNKFQLLWVFFFFSNCSESEKMRMKSTMLKIHPPHMHVLRKKVQDVSPFET